jgi:hypothetical protein
MRLCTDDSQETMGYRQEVTLGADPFGPNGFPEVFRRHGGGSSPYPGSRRRRAS